MSITLDRPSPTTTTTTLTLVPLPLPTLRGIRSWTDQQAVHQAVMSLFPPTLPGDPTQRRATGDILHRHDTPTNRPARLLIQHVLPMRPEYANDPALHHADLTPLLASLRPGQPVRFRIVLNPVRNKSRSNVRVPITDPHDLIDWGIKKLTENGLHHIQLSDQPRTTLMSAKTPLWTAQYDGRALVNDPHTTRQALLHGIGRSKAYGCGLLSLAPTQI